MHENILRENMSSLKNTANQKVKDQIDIKTTNSKQIKLKK